MMGRYGWYHTHMLTWLMFKVVRTGRSYIVLWNLWGSFPFGGQGTKCQAHNDQGPKLLGTIDEHAHFKEDEASKHPADHRQTRDQTSGIAA